MEQAEKTPHRFTTVQGITVPDPSQAGNAASVRQIVGSRMDRETVVISNTGMNPVFIGNSPQNAQNNGFTVAGGGAISLDTQEAVFAYATTAKSTTLDVLETLYFNSVQRNPPAEDERTDQ
jgi:hypothetical protein